MGVRLNGWVSREEAASALLLRAWHVFLSFVSPLHRWFPHRPLAWDELLTFIPRSFSSIPGVRYVKDIGTWTFKNSSFAYAFSDPAVIIH